MIKLIARVDVGRILFKFIGGLFSLTVAQTHLLTLTSLDSQMGAAATWPQSYWFLNDFNNNVPIQEVCFVAQQYTRACQLGNHEIQT